MRKMRQALFGMFLLRKRRIEVQVNQIKLAFAKDVFQISRIGANQAHVAKLLLNDFLRRARDAYVAVVDSREQHIRVFLRNLRKENALTAAQVQVKSAGVGHERAYPAAFYGSGAIDDRLVVALERHVQICRFSLAHGFLRLCSFAFAFGGVWTHAFSSLPIMPK